ncbi:hypothetical protein [Polyangium aurulentum]|uniref:hypothetical protein n=1 Tax=Polyangium aurulentum TaxID=2567896 RepID=UPI0010AED1C9|nr:hypothetical protein [Polyangium aurulentum]UQA62592.1 hypothetical protein E8A73_019915 [Polyangium aurulentum]
MSVSLLAVLATACGDGNTPSASASGTGGSGGVGGSGGSGGIGGGDTGGGGSGGSGGNGVDPTDGAWRSTFGLPGLDGQGARGTTVVRGADGRIYAGGIFSDAAGTKAANVAVWTGSGWEALGDGLPGTVNTLALGPDGALYAGGSFYTAADPDNHVARWNGQSWTMLPGAIGGPVRALATVGNRLLVAGSFSTIDNKVMPGIVAYDKNSGWAPIDKSGVDFEAWTILPTGGESFCIGGYFAAVDGIPAANAACWDGAAWAELGDGLPGGVVRLARGPDGKFYAGGNFTYAVDPANDDFRSGIAVLEGGTWDPFEGGVENGFITEVRAIAFAPDGDLLIGGTFEAADHLSPVPARNLARFDFGGGGWSELGGGAGNDVGVAIGSVVGVNDILVEDDGSFIVAGFYSTVNNGKFQASNIGRLAGDTWSTLVNGGIRYDGVGGLLNDMALDAEGRVVAGGHFQLAGGTYARHVARYSSKQGWEALGEGFDDTVYDVLVRKNGDVIAGGMFYHAGNAVSPFLARWDGSAWSQGFPALDGVVHTLLEDAEGNLYVGGDFYTAGNVSANRVARWDGSQWAALDAGFDGRVTALAIDGKGHLVATGLFRNAGNKPVNGIASWDGAQWQPFGAGFPEFEYGSHLVPDGDGFIVTGAFESVDGHPFAGIARWDGAAWSGFGSGLSTNSGFGFVVTSVVRYGNGLFATGTFDQAGDTPLAHVAFWDGANWKPLGAGLADLGESLLLQGNTLWVGGSFVEAGGQVSSGIAAWDFSP